ncbi:MAG TPA: MMPL family transporter [Flavobacteriales bacterium]|nr:MMPL family transporter [Flavobacteriales bacterium]HNI05723.1 MMPL family transporter [Flavobacteriales bacterium]HNK67946.1 MMPL family transporter [Flavobacteriales bacterium]HNM68131.1 MMPL family transporter [Flavobacteriales bacterium]HNO04506.1 MMPL family transporter [Flavobacteriales bacterium]
MWEWLASRVLRNRTAILIGVLVVTVFMGYMATTVGMSYKHGGLLPKTDSAYVEYERFKERFGEDGNTIVVGAEGHALYTPAHFKAWYELGNALGEIQGIDSIFSEAHLFELVRDDSLRRFAARRVMDRPPVDQGEMDTLLARIRALPFYNGLLYNDSTGASLMMVFVNAAHFNTEGRSATVKAFGDRVDAFAKETGIPVHVSGLPWIRVKSTQLVKAEMPVFMALSLFVCGLLLLLFFRSWRVTFICLGVVAVSVVWSFGSMGLLGYNITILQSVIAPLVIVTGVPNCVFLINAYHYEYVRHGNKVKALQRVISRIGAAAFMTNATTAVGFTTFCVTDSDTLIEFGWVATIGIMVLWALSMLLIPILFSYFPPPKKRHLSHLDRRWLDRTVDWIVNTSRTRRPLIYTTTGVLTVFAFIGIWRMKDESRIVDDLPADNPVLTDLRFFEANFRGVMPLEVEIDTRKKGGVFTDAVLRRIDRLEDTLATYPQFSRSISIVDAVKFTKQAFYGGDPGRYELLNNTEKPFILPYIEGARDKEGMARGFLDSTRQTTRLTVQMADVGTTRMEPLLAKLRTQVDSLFNPERYTVTLTGTCVTFLKGSSYLVSNLITSLFWAVVIIVALMAFLFNSMRILIVALIPNIIPLLFTAGLMGFFGIPIKPSTMLVFGIALGIAVDNAIHFLARYRLELKLTNNDLRASVDLATREVSVGIIYTSVVLLAGFGLFGFSRFGGIRALGVLTTLTLLVAMLTNLLVLPSLLLSLNRFILTRAFREPLLEILDEEEDIELMELKLDAPEPGPGTVLNDDEQGPDA